MRLSDFKNRVNVVIQKTKKKPLDLDVLEYLRPFAERLDIPVEELALNLHVQGIYKFDDIEEVLDLEDYND